MPQQRWATTCLAALFLSACNPTLNWREVRFEQAPLVALLPCKPDQGTRTLPMGDRSINVTMQGCEAGGLLFTVAVAQVNTADEAGALLKPWKEALLANARATGSSDRPFTLAGATPWPDAVLASFRGERTNGELVVGQVALFAREGQVYQGAVFGERLGSEATDTFFGGLKLR